MELEYSCRNVMQLTSSPLIRTGIYSSSSTNRTVPAVLVGSFISTALTNTNLVALLEVLSGPRSVVLLHPQRSRTQASLQAASGGR